MHQTEWPTPPEVKNQGKPCWIVGYVHDKTEKVTWNKIMEDCMDHDVFYVGDWHHSAYVSGW